MEHKSKVHSNVVSKTFQKNGKWIERPGGSTIVVCLCGNKYLKTRKDQFECLTCMSRKAI
jgi:hypothetical protein